MAEHNENASKRVAQHKLARDVVDFVHGKEAAAEAEKAHGSVFRSRRLNRDEAMPEDQYWADGARANWPESVESKDATGKAGPNLNPSISLPCSLVYDQPISRVLFHAGLVASKSEGQRLVAKGGAYVGARPSGGLGDQIDFIASSATSPQNAEKYIIDGDLLLLRVGKWKVKIVKVVSDIDFREQGLTAPGWQTEGESEETSWHSYSRMEMTKPVNRA